MAAQRILLIGDSFMVPETEWETIKHLNFLGGSPIGNSRVKVRVVLCCVVLCCVGENRKI